MIKWYLSPECKYSSISANWSVWYTINKLKNKNHTAIIKKSPHRDCREKGTLLCCWWKCKLVQLLWRTIWRLLKKLKLELPYDPAIPLLGIYLEKTTIWRDICTSTFISSPFTIAKTWKQPKYLSIEKWMKKVWYLYTMKHYSVIKKNIAICSNMDWPRDNHTNWSKPEKERQIPYNVTCMWNLKYGKMNLFTKQK